MARSVGEIVGVIEGIAVCVSTMAGSITTVELAVAGGIDTKLLQDDKVTATKKNIVVDLLMNFITLSFLQRSA